MNVNKINVDHANMQLRYSKYKKTKHIKFAYAVWLHFQSHKISNSWSEKLKEINEQFPNIEEQYQLWLSLL